MECPELANTYTQKSNLVIAQGWQAAGKWLLTTNGYKVSFWGDENVLKWIVVMTEQPFEYTKDYGIVYLLNLKILLKNCKNTLVIKHNIVKKC